VYEKLKHLFQVDFGACWQWSFVSGHIIGGGALVWISALPANDKAATLTDFGVLLISEKEVD